MARGAELHPEKAIDAWIDVDFIYSFLSVVGVIIGIIEVEGIGSAFDGDTNLHCMHACTMHLGKGGGNKKNHRI